MYAITTKAGRAVELSFQSSFTEFLNSIQPIIISSGDVAHEGIDLKRGAKKVERQKSTPHTHVLRPVFAPALIPAAFRYLIFSICGIIYMH